MDNYEIYKDKELGRGSYSIVYLGINKQNNNKVAIKEINIQNKSSKFYEAIENEIILIKKIMKNPHPNIVEFYDIIKTTKSIYYVMEYCDGEDLCILLKGAIKERIAKFYFTQIFEGLNYLHQNKIMHRDLKPKNILLTNNKTCIKIADFGFAKKVSSIQRCFTMCGSPLYMAPEILSRSSYGKESDFWSLGIILFEMIYGFNPFRHCTDINDIAILSKNSRINIPPKKSNIKNISRECIDLMRKLLERDDSKRITWEQSKNHIWLKEFQTINKKVNNIIDSDESDNSDNETSNCMFIMDD
ncbi:MAG: hypothetical protein CMF62_03350 [Magnetococcales bacterium]|nr:hypothetical protein [Magnetococcales bacterium]|tara:strand:+ start:13674 stop:14576 length:903 start_codon:yes stop_codon:yes gene_type:complete